MGPISPLFAAEFHLNDTQLSLLTGACVLALGFANYHCSLFQYLWSALDESFVLPE
jgi:hypothetical protein